MSRIEWTPEKVAAAKKAAAGPLGKTLGKMPFYFATPIIIGNYQTYQNRDEVNTATSTLLNLESQHFAVTCKHVFEHFLKRHTEDSGVSFQVGEVPFEPSSRVRPFREHVDLVAIELDGLDLSRINKEIIGSSFYRPRIWPPQRVNVGDFVSVGGFPGTIREHDDRRGITFPTFGVAASPVASVTDDHFVIQFDRDYWEISFDYSNRAEVLRDLKQLRGMSGGPVMMERRSAAGLSVFDLVGIAYEFSENFDLLYAIHTDLIDIGGEIRDPQ